VTGAREVRYHRVSRVGLSDIQAVITFAYHRARTILLRLRADLEPGGGPVECGQPGVHAGLESYGRGRPFDGAGVVITAGCGNAGYRARICGDEVTLDLGVLVMLFERDM
jgi:hypothetical protein